MTKVLVLGSNGMLGRYVHSYLSSLSDTNVTGYSRSEFNVLRNNVSDLKLLNFDVVVNCIGVIKQIASEVEHTDIIRINSIFPHILARACQNSNTQLIHITTDCVYSGIHRLGTTTGFYTELAPHDPLDVYGKTKSLGEPSEAMNIRTSIIGEELHTSRSLIEWVKSNNNKKINGYTNHTWNGVTCLELAKFIGKCIHSNRYWEGTRHIFNTTPTTKMELVELIAKHFNLTLDIAPMQTTDSIYRTLDTIYTREIETSIDEQLAELAQYKL